MNDQISLYSDALLFMTSLGAALYCMRLQGKIKRLQRTDKGIGQAIKSMVDATHASKDAAAVMREQLAESVADLDERYAKLELRRQEIDDLLDTMEGQMGLQVKRCHEARQLTEKALTPLVHKAEMEIHALTRALEVSTRFAAVKKGLHPEEEDMEVLRSTLDRSESREANPFLRAVGA